MERNYEYAHSLLQNVAWTSVITQYFNKPKRIGYVSPITLAKTKVA
jgi:hypothetical protein